MKILTISVHPDDETLGCGGTLLKHKDLGDELYWLIITSVNEELGYSNDFILSRKNQIEEVGKIYGFKKVFELGLPTTRLHDVDFSEILKGINKSISEVNPERIYMINRTDIHTDHQITARALFSATKSFRNLTIKEILMYECISETEMAPGLLENVFIPNVFSDISNYIDKKVEIMNIYKQELQETPMPRSAENIKALARFRGSTVGVDYAEAFMLIRKLF